MVQLASPTRSKADRILERSLGIVASFTVLALVGIFILLLANGFQAFTQISLLDFLFGTDWNPNSYNSPSWGISALVMGTLMIAVTSLVVSVPLGLAIAIYLSELASPRIREILKPLMEMIASIPSVTLGLLGLLYLAPLIAGIFSLSNGINALTASLLVAVSALPTIASMSEDALSSVPKKYRESSFALGATKGMTIFRVVVPAAKRGLIAAIMLGLGRIIGETMIVLMVAGNSREFPTSLLSPVRPITANIAIEIKEVVYGSLHWDSLFALGLVLFLLTFVINFLADLLIHRKI